MHYFVHRAHVFYKIGKAKMHISYIANQKTISLNILYVLF